MGGGILGGALGELFGPEAVIPGAMIGRQLGRWGGQLAGSALAEWLASHMSNANEQADKDKEGASDQSDACSNCGPPLKPPNRRHDPCRVKNNDPPKANNTMIDPESKSQVDAEVRSIRNGEVPRQRGKYVVNGRTYGVHNEALYPESGPGFVNVSRGTFKVLRELNSNGYESAMNLPLRTQASLHPTSTRHSNFGASARESESLQPSSVDTLMTYDARTIFIARAQADEVLTKSLQSVFSLSPNQVVTDHDPTEALYDAMATGKWIIVRHLDALGSFNLSAEMEFSEHIDPRLFLALAEQTGSQIAYSFNESDPNDFRYYIATPTGLEVRELTFEDTQDSVICNVVC